MAAPQRTKRRYGLPWAGYQSSAAPHMCPADKATSDGPSSTRRSQNYLFNPLEGKFYRRAGSAYVGSTTGILENGTGELTVARARQLISMRSASLSNGYPTHAVLWTEEGNNKGCVYFRDTNASADHVLGQEFGTTQYPTALGSPSYMKALPYVRTTDDTIGRFNTLALRGIVAAGSRRMLEVGDQLLMPDLSGTPLRWDKKFNENDADTGDIWRVWHTGSPPPLGLPTITTGTLNAAGSWHEGDTFYISVAFRMADGSVTMPIIPRDRNDDINFAANSNHTGLGKISLVRSGSGFDDRYLYLLWTTIPIGPNGCIGRYLLRTPKLNGVASGDPVAANTEGTSPTPLDLRITHYIGNNTQTSYIDPNGNDLSLQTDPLLVRFDHIMPPAARYISSFDGRVMVGYTKPNPVAIYLAPNVNVGDNDATLDDVKYEFDLSGGTLTLRKDAGSTTLTNIGSASIQTLVDRINNTTSGGGGGKWWACVAPGADLSATCDDVGTAADNDNLVSVTGATDYSGDTAGRIRAYSPSYPACIFFSSTYLANFPTEKRRIFFTMGGAGMPTYAANSWAAGNFRTAPESWGDYMGSAPLKNGAVVCFSKAIGTIENRKGGTSGLDEDFRLYDLNLGRGCIAWDSICEFNGAVGYLTADGFVVTDGKEEVIVSGDVWNAATQTGEWAYEITQSGAAAAADSDLSHFHAKVMGGKLYITYRLAQAGEANGASFPNRMLVYDFTGSAQYSGLRGVLRPDGQPWGWSTPLKPNATLGGGGGQTWSVMGEVVNASGINRYATDEDTTHTSMTSNGTIFQIETGTQDNTSAIAADLWTARDLAESLKKKSVEQLRLIYKKNGSGLTLAGYRDGLGTTADASLTIPTTGSNNFDALPLPLPTGMRSQARSHEFKLSDDGSAAGAAEIWGVEADLLLVDSYT